MKMKLGAIALALMGATAAAAFPPASASAAPYTASGSEPFWSLTIAHGRIDYSRDEAHVIVPLPARRPTAHGYRYATRRLTVEIVHGECQDVGELSYADSVRVTANGATVEGCGGAVLAPSTLAETDWQIVAIGAAAVSGDDYVMQFSGGRLSGQAGCNHFSGPYRQNHATLRPGAIIATRMACPGARMAHERAVLRVLAGPVRISFPQGDVMVLSGSGGTVRLRRN
jgi:heat shock protein HslJ